MTFPFTDNYGVAQLYRRIISPSVKLQNEEWQKQTHYRHTNYKSSQSPVNRLKMASPVHSVASAPGHLEPHDLSLQVVLHLGFIISLGNKMYLHQRVPHSCRCWDIMSNKHGLDSWSSFFISIVFFVLFIYFYYLFNCLFICLLIYLFIYVIIIFFAAFEWQ